MHTAPGVRIGIGEPAPGIAGFRQSHTEAAEARRIADLAHRPAGTITRYAHVALRAIATSDLDQARIFVTRQLQGMAGDDEVTARLTATLRTYLAEHSSRSRTAKRLGIHENTVSYRIKQAEELLGHSVDQGTLDLRVALALSNLVRDRPDWPRRSDGGFIYRSLDRGSRRARYVRRACRSGCGSWGTAAGGFRCGYRRAHR